MDMPKVSRAALKRPGLSILGAIVLALPCMATNSVAISNTSGAQQTGRPFTIFRVFVQGEIVNYPHPRANGSLLPVWQSNINTRWPDGSVQQALISFVTNLPAGAVVTVDFVNDSNSCYVGSLAACNSAAPTQSQILGFNSGNWGAGIETANAGSSQSASATTMIQNGDWRFWIMGPVANIIIAEDRTSTLKYDFGWHCASGCAPAGTATTFLSYSPSTWSLDATNRSLHPIFVLTQYQGWPGVKTEYILENDWISTVQDQKYDLTLKSGPSLSTVQFSRSGLVHIADSRWRETFWDGQTPGSVNIDFNLPYLIASHAIANYDTTKVVSGTAMNAEISRWNASDQADIASVGTTFAGTVTKGFPNTGSREDIGLIPQWAVIYLFTMNPTLYDQVIGDAEAMAHAPNHYREATSNRFFDDLHTVNALGRTVSADARPGFLSRDVLDTGLSYPADRPTVVGGVSANYWNSMDVAHQPDPTYLAYLLTGDWYFLEEIYFWSAYNLTAATPGPATCIYCRHDSWAFMTDSYGNTRGVAWDMRTVAHSAWIAPDGSPEKTYFFQKLEYNIAVHEGLMNVTNGPFYGDPRWTWGQSISTGLPNPLGWISHNLGYELTQGTGYVDPTKACFADAPWQQNYVNVSWGHIEELGFTDITPTRQASAKNLLHMILDPTYSPKNLIAGYLVGTRAFATNCFASLPFTTWPQVVASITPTELGYAATRWEEGATNAQGAYPAIAFGASSFLIGISDGPYTGADAWTWMQNNVSNQSYLNDNPMWAFVPRSSTGSTTTGSTPPVTTTPGSPTPVSSSNACDLNGDGVVNSSDVQIAVNQALGVAPCGSADLQNNGTCNVADVQRVINAALGQACVTGP
jgi:hypothetical protein